MSGAATAETGILSQEDRPATCLMSTRVTRNHLATGLQALRPEELEFLFCWSCHPLVIQEVGFAADATTRTNAEQQELLADLVCAARSSGLKVDKVALCYSVGRRTEFFGIPDVVRYLIRSGVPRWTHTVQV